MVHLIVRMPPNRTLRGSFAVGLALLGLSCRPDPGPVIAHAPIDTPVPTGRTASPDRPLAAGDVLDLDLAAGVSWRAELTPESESLVILVVEQRGLDVRTSLATTDGLEIESVDGLGGIGTDERLAARLAAGSFSIFLSPASDGPQEGRVRLRIDTLRAWRDGDLEWVRLTRLGQEATHLDASDANADWDRAYEMSFEELAGWRMLRNTAGVVRALNRITSLGRELEGKLEESVASGREAVALSLDAGDTRAEIISRYWLALSLDKQDDVAGVERELAIGLEHAETIDDLLLQGRILNWQGISSRRRGDYPLARDLSLRALDARTRAHDLKGVSSILNNLGLIASAFGEYPEALAYYREAIDKARLASRVGNELSAQGNMSRLLRDRGQWQEALDAFSEGVARARSVGDLRNEARLGTDLGRMLLILGEPEPARKVLERSLEIETATGTAFRRIAILLSLAAVHATEERYDEAEALLRSAQQICRRAELTTQEAFVLRDLADLALRRGEPGAALALLERTRLTPVYPAQPLLQAKTLRDFAEAHTLLGHPRRALDYLAAALAALGELAMPELRFEIGYQRARARRAEGDLEGALEEVEAALDLVESLRSSVSDSDLQATFLSRVREAYAFGVDLLIEMHEERPEAGYDRLAFTTLERARARSLADLLARARSGAEIEVEPRLLEAERSARAELNLVREQLEATEAKDDGEDPNAKTAELEELRDALRSAQEQLLEVEEEVRRSAPRYASLRYSRTVPVAELQAALRPGTTLVEYALLPEASIAFVVTQDRFEALRLAAEDVVAAKAAPMRELLTDPSRRNFGKLKQYSRELARLIVDPVLQAAGPSSHLVVVPDGPLATIPFEALRIGGARERYLVEDMAVSYAPSAGVLLALAEQNGAGSHGSGFAGFADPAGDDSRPRLPGARREVAKIAQALTPKHAALVLMDAAASETRLKGDESVRGARWIHIASHTRIEEALPADSAVVLAPGQDEDGYLTAREVFGLKLEAELVVLSGCETALGRQIRGEGLIGLSRAFLYAGAGGLQVSLWKVDDGTTPDLMTDFYRALSQGVGAAEALRQAKIASLDDGRAHPFRWAAFVVIGGWTPP